jgi:glycerate dehydrogenase
MQGVFLDTATMNPEELDTGALEQSGLEWCFHDVTAPEQLGDRITGASVVVTNKVVLDRRVIESADDLRLICVSATGTNNVDLEAAREKGIPVCNVTGYATDSVAQHTLALILGLATRWHRYNADVRAGAWSDSPVFCMMHHPVMELAGKTLGIIGYGTLGRAVSRLGQALGMKVLVCASLRPGATETPGRTPLSTLLAESDVVSLHCPQTPETERLINAETLAQMKSGALLVNTARGGLVDPAALLSALESGQLAGVALDVLEREPPPADHPLLRAKPENLIITPHNAWVSRECRQRLLDGVAANIRAWEAGRLTNCVNGMEVA